MATRSRNVVPASGRKDAASAILAAAEKLYGRHGLDGVTIRQVTLAAGMGNNSAVAYHFGNKEGLLRAICEWRMPQLEHAGAAEWDRVKSDGRLDDPASLIGVLLRPFLVVKDGSGQHVHAAFMHQMLRSATGRSIRVSIFDVSVSTVRALARLEAVLVHVPRDLLRYRLRIAGAAFFDGLGEWDLGEKDPEFPNFTLPQLVDELIGQAAAACGR